MESSFGKYLRRFTTSLQPFTPADHKKTKRSVRARNLKLEPLEQRQLLSASPLDFGDAPLPYATTMASDGARHVCEGPTLGGIRDWESDGIFSVIADGDDNASEFDDEDGVILPVLSLSATAATTASVEIILQNADATANRLDAWIDFNQDGDWNDQDEQIFASYDLGTTNGSQSLTFTLPQDTGENIVYGMTFARFRLSTAGGLSPLGLADDGEVEDYPVSLTWFTSPAALNTNACADLDHDYTPQIVTDGVGHWVAVWYSDDSLNGTIGDDSDILVSRSVDAGATWSAPVALNSNAETDSGHDYFPELSTDGYGNWVAVWHSDESLGNTIAPDHDILVSRSTDAGVTWSAPMPLNNNAAYDSERDVLPQIANDRAGNWVVAWRSRNDLGGTIGTDDDILFSRSTNAGATWSDPEPLNSFAGLDSAEDSYVEITTDYAGNWIALWQSRHNLGGTIGGDYDILMSRSVDAGATWSDAVAWNTNAASDTGQDYSPQLATDGAGNWIGVWNSTDSLGGKIGEDHDILVARSVDDGASWSAPVALNLGADSDSGEDVEVQITSDGAGAWIAVWRSEDSVGGTIGTDRDILVSRSFDRGATWGTPVPLNSNAGLDSGVDFGPRLTTDGAGNWVAAWYSSDSLGGTIGDYWDILFTTFSGAIPGEAPDSGNLDPTFGDGGIVRTDIGNSGADDYGVDAVGQPDGKIVVVGRSGDVGQLLRYDTDGSLDRSFGDQGQVALSIQDSWFDPKAVTLQSDGKILVAGYHKANSGDRNFGVLRFNSDGVLDTSFGTAGHASIDFGNTNDYAFDVTIQEVNGDERIVIAGHSYQGASGADFAVTRLDSDGSLDTSFSSDGKATTSFDSGEYADKAWGVAAKPDGEIVLVGETNTSSGELQFAVACFNVDGSPNLAFDGDGMLTTAVGTHNDAAYDVAFQGERLVVAGYSDQDGQSNQDFAVVRYNADGSLDSSFGGDGMVTTHMGPTYEWDLAYGMALSGDQIVVAGRTYQGESGWDFGLVRYNQDGSLDPHFGIGGMVVTPISPTNGYDRAEAVVIQRDRIIVVGYSYTDSNSGYDIALAAYGSELAPGFISGTRFEDLNGNGVQDTGEPGIAGVVYLDSNNNGLLDAANTLEPDVYPDGTSLNSALPEATLTAVDADGIAYLGGGVVATIDALAPTGTTSFGHAAGSAWSQATVQLRVDFSQPVSLFSLDVAAGTSGAIGRIDLYDMQGNLLDIVLTSSLPTGSVQTLRVVRSSEDIAYAIAGSAAGAVHLDNLAFGAAETWVTAGPNGGYVFQDVPIGDHAVRQEIPQGWEQTNLVDDAFFYAIDRYGAELLKIDPATGNVTVVGPHGAGVRLHGLVKTNSGELYAVAGDGTDSFYQIDPNTGQATLIDAIGANVAWGLAYDSATDTIYTHSWGQLAVLDRTTGHVCKRYGDSHTFAGVGGIAFDDTEQRIVFYDSVVNQFYAYDTEGNFSTLAATDAYLCYGFTYTGDTFVMSRSWYDGDGENRSKVLLSVDPDTGTMEPLVNMSEVRIIETLEYVAAQTGAHEVHVGQAEMISQLDFGNVAVDTVPTALPDQVTVTEDDSIAIDVLANDSDADGNTLVTAAVQAISQLGVPLSINPDGTIAYNAGGLFDALAAGENITDSFRYRVGDGTGNIDAAVVTVTITGVNDAPTLTGIPDLAFDEDSSGVSIDLDAYYSDAETLAEDAAFEIVSAFSGVSAAIDPVTHVLTVVGDENFNGAGEIVVRVTDTAGGTSMTLSADATIVVTVNAVNDAPTLTAIPDVTFDEDSFDAGTDLNAYYWDVETLAENATFEIVSAFSGVSAVIDPVTHVLTIVGDENLNGAGEIVVRVTDTGDGTSTALSADATIVVTVTPVNDAPVANSQSVTVTEDGVVLITLSASDVETNEENLIFTITSLPEGGTLKEGDGNEITLDENGDIVNGVFVGAPTLTFEPGAACDGERATSFSFTVTDRGDPDNDPLGDMAITSVPAAVTINVVKAVEDGQVVLGADGVLRIGGTAGDDVIAVAASCLCDSVLVVINDSITWTIPLDSVNEIRVWGREGNDAVALVGLEMTSLIHGGAGDDLLCGAAGDDLVFGGRGDDILIGAAGNDVLVGGDGVDRIIGSAGHDILVAGDVSCNYTDEALREISAEWTIDLAADESEADDLVDEAILDDDFDMLTGSSGSDWFIIGDGDWITDIRKAEKDGDLITEV